MPASTAPSEAMVLVSVDRLTSLLVAVMTRLSASTTAVCARFSVVVRVSVPVPSVIAPRLEMVFPALSRVTS